MAALVLAAPAGAAALLLLLQRIEQWLVSDDSRRSATTGVSDFRAGLRPGTTSASGRAWTARMPGYPAT